mgnify:CR=1 FL=1
MGEFSEGVFEQVRRIPRGKCATYGQIARLMGRPRSARYVGYALRSNPAPGADEADIPCHRVIFKDGSLCKGFAFGGPEVQRAMLLGPPPGFDWERELGDREEQAPGRRPREHRASVGDPAAASTFSALR